MAACVAKGRSSSPRLNGILRTFLPNVLSLGLYTSPFWIGTKFNTADDPTGGAPLRPPSSPPPPWALEASAGRFESFDARARDLSYDASAPALSDLATARPNSATENAPAPLPMPEEVEKGSACALTAFRVVAYESTGLNLLPAPDAAIRLAPASRPTPEENETPDSRGAHTGPASDDHVQPPLVDKNACAHAPPLASGADEGIADLTDDASAPALFDLVVASPLSTVADTIVTAVLPTPEVKGKGSACALTPVSGAIAGPTVKTDVRSPAGAVAGPVPGVAVRSWERQPI